MAALRSQGGAEGAGETGKIAALRSQGGAGEAEGERKFGLSLQC